MREELPKFYYQADKKFSYLIYESAIMCKSTFFAKTTLPNAQKDAEAWSKTLNSHVDYSSPENIIFVIKKQNTAHEHTQLWNVIIGTKAGWIIVRDQDRFVEVELDEK